MPTIQIRGVRAEPPGIGPLPIDPGDCLVKRDAIGPDHLGGDLTAEGESLQITGTRAFSV